MLLWNYYKMNTNGFVAVAVNADDTHSHEPRGLSDHIGFLLIDRVNLFIWLDISMQNIVND